MKYSFQRALPLAIALATVSIAPAAPIIFQRQLPTTNLNNAAGANRSNAAPIQGSFSGVPYVLGDDFNLSGVGSFTIDSISVYMVTNTLAGTPSSEFSAIQLYGGVDAALSLRSSTYSASKVQYAGGLDYQSLNSSTFFSLVARRFARSSI